MQRLGEIKAGKCFLKRRRDVYRKASRVTTIWKNSVHTLYLMCTTSPQRLSGRLEEVNNNTLHTSTENALCKVLEFKNEIDKLAIRSEQCKVPKDQLKRNLSEQRLIVKTRIHLSIHAKNIDLKDGHKIYCRSSLRRYYELSVIDSHFWQCNCQAMEKRLYTFCSDSDSYLQSNFEVLFMIFRGQK